MIWMRALICAVAFCAVVPAFGQYGDGHIRTGRDTIKIDSTGITVDTLTTDTLANDTLVADSTFFQQIDSADEGDGDESIEPNTFFKKRGGFFGGATVDLTGLKPSSLDPILDGDLVIYGAQGYLVLNSWMLGGAGTSATLYNLSPKYDRFSFGYGGFLTGYDTRIFHGSVTLQGSLLIGGGGLEMIRKRTDIIDTSGHDILERYRDEGFFLLRPGISIGFTPIQYVEFAIGADYLLPIGGKDVGDLRAFTYGLRLTFGLGD
jgi:hypothetical protein